MDPDPPDLYLLVASTDITAILGFVVLAVLLICSALVSGAEVALFSLSRSDIENEQGKNSKQIEIISRLLQQP
ncbi:MAG: DUF21 domain-containing protein, partial [Bacteroidia bacterium]|nr:DUF21 domain-containing protein [Bacteroidia bacterium]